MKKILLIASIIVFFYSLADTPYRAVGEISSEMYSKAGREFYLICDSILELPDESKIKGKSDIVDNIKFYIKMKAIPNKDTMHIGDTFLIDIIFTNISDKKVAFYPKGYLNMSYFRDTTHLYFSVLAPDYGLRIYPEFRDLKYLSPDSSLTESYEIRVEPYFFRLGENRLEILYSSYDFMDKKLRTIMKLYGILWSNEFNIMVEPKNDN